MVTKLLGYHYQNEGKRRQYKKHKRKKKRRKAKTTQETQEKSVAQGKTMP